MEQMRQIVEAELQSTDALADVWGKMPEQFQKELVDLVLQKMSWAFERGKCVQSS